MNARSVLLTALAFALALSARAAPPASPLILISLDGFRWDYCEKYPAETATLRQLQRDGVSSRGLIPVFPSNTFPNHYTIVTGLYPARHGIVNNVFFEPASGLIFRYNQPASVRDSRWWGGEPIWVTAIRQGRKAAASFWVGSEAEIGGVRPTFWKPYDYSIPFETRLDEVVGWLKPAEGDAPGIVALYLEETNSAGHTYGPDSAEIAAAVNLCDSRIAALLARFRGAGLEPNLLIVSDHGMTGIHPDRVVILDDYIDLKKVQLDDDGSLVSLRPLDGDNDTLLRALEKIPHAKAFKSADLPPHLRYAGNPRISPLWVLPDDGWHVETRANHERLRKRYASMRGYLGGDHGYDPALRNMHGLFIAHGPAFRRGVELPEFENIHLYNLMCAVLRVKPAPNDGDDRLIHSALLAP